MNAWTAIVPESAPLARRVWEAIDGITEAVVESEGDLARPRTVQHESALLYGYLGLVRQDPTWLERAAERLNLAIEDAEELASSHALFGGVTGLGWAIEHLSRYGADYNPDSNREIDLRLLRVLSQGEWRGAYDLASGLVGMGVYFLERLPTDHSEEGLRLILGHLEQAAEETEKGITWHTRPGLLPPHQLTVHPAGYYNLGVAHGVPGVIFLLDRLEAHEIEPKRARVLLEGAVAWLISREAPPDAYSRFSPFLSSSKLQASRLAWCYGDLGIAAVLLQTAGRTRHEGWISFARELIERCLCWPLNQAGVVDAPLCHGAVGVAHCFNRMYRLDGDDRCREAALRWIETALSMRKNGVRGGFVTMKGGPIVSLTFLDGLIGLALGLLSAVSSIEPSWDRLLLLSTKNSFRQ
ncbi:MAG: lanthionine synthetase C family protein [Acidobacteriaceae bacterium]|nr:lanthionine synthetase C family protein [Acidobacteriaceae bacterium]